VRKHASQRLKASIDATVADVKRLQGKPLTDAFKTLDALKTNKKTKPSASDRAKKKPPRKPDKPRRRS
jgi:hypothetical protein